MSMGYVVNGVYIKKAGNMSIENTPLATDATNGLMSYADKQKIEAMYTSEDVASKTTIESLFD